MKKFIKRKICDNFRPINDYVPHYRNKPTQNCSECIYFSSRNCGLDISDSIEPELEIF